MLTLEEIKKEYNELIWKKSPKAILVEYLQYEILDSVFKQKNSDKLSFMGGTAIRIVHGGNRFSEDLDFDNFGLTFGDFEDVLKKSIKDMENKGFEIEIRLVKKGAYHAYIKFPNLLFDNQLSPHASEKILIKIDTVLKEKTFKPEIFILNGFDIYKKIIVNPKNIVLSQKIIAILERKKTKGRDFFDVSYLLSKADPDYNYLERFANIKNQQQLKKELLTKTSDLNLKKLARDVEPFLINPDEKERIVDFRNYIEQKL